MSRRNLAPAFLLALSLAVPALGQPAGDVAVINTHTPKPGATAKYETARKNHMAWHKAQKDTWTWNTWEVVSGEGSGTYYTASFAHAWKDFDTQEKFEKADTADFDKNIGPTLGRSFTSYYLRRGDLSLTPPSATPPTPYSFLTFFLLKPEGVNDFQEAVKKINEGIKKTNWKQQGPSSWYQLVNGGEGPMYVLAGGRDNWAAFAPNEKSLDVMMEEAFGKDGAAILAKARNAIRSSRTETIKYRPDLSYVPPPPAASR
ncbi:MAG TPA: hypothetical protein VFI53_07780 [Myxococcaceae bacterium]|nr:hypothetical protein [Myxococcaceae bacterium]